MAARSDYIRVVVASLTLLSCSPKRDPDTVREEHDLARVEASTLCNDNADNPVRARSKYLSKRIAVELHVVGIETWASGSRVQLWCGRKDVQVHAIFPETSNSAVARLKVADPVTIDCLVSDTGYSLSLDACSVVRQPQEPKAPTPSIEPIPAEQLTSGRPLADAERAADLERYERIMKEMDAATSRTTKEALNAAPKAEAVMPARPSAVSGAASIFPGESPAPSSTP